ncbi:MAG: apolipoprotein N-acyltransferase, partial [Bacteroidales bacterium]|nr:apolipoprotein N-acyltransferase [Bacteroidales bacterium]
SFLMLLAFFLFHVAKNRLGKRMGYAAFITLWLSYEFIYMHGQISWPWLTLGNGFLYNIKLIQWYDVTGVFGGSLWVLLVNLLAYNIFDLVKGEIKERKSVIINGAVVLLLVGVPVLISLVKFSTYKEKDAPYDIVVVQPNIDPYLKFNDISPEEQAAIQLNEAAALTDSLVDFVVAPETSLLGRFWIGHFEDVNDIRMIRNFLDTLPNVNYVTGIVCRKKYEPGEPLGEFSIPWGNSGYHYDYYNSAILVDTTRDIQIYHKSQLVTGIEKMPYAHQLRFLKKLMVNLGGTFRSNSIQKERDVFSPVHDTVKAAPVICWESVFGQYVTDYIKKGAHMIFVITNDGWWHDTPGHRQHNALSSIRAIETRRSVARSANTGVSSFINQRGEVLNKLTWWERGAIRNTINANDTITFYVKHGDYIGRTALWVSVLLLAAVFVRFFMKK